MKKLMLAFSLLVSISAFADGGDLLVYCKAITTGTRVFTAQSIEVNGNQIQLNNGPVVCKASG